MGLRLNSCPQFLYRRSLGLQRRDSHSRYAVLLQLYHGGFCSAKTIHQGVDCCHLARFSEVGKHSRRKIRGIRFSGKFDTGRVAEALVTGSALNHLLRWRHFSCWNVVGNEITFRKIVFFPPCRCAFAACFDAAKYLSISFPPPFVLDGMCDPWNASFITDANISFLGWFRHWSWPNLHGTISWNMAWTILIVNSTCEDDFLLSPRFSKEITRKLQT